MRVVLSICLALACWLGVLPATALAEKRVALVIGNKGYAEKVGPLKNPHNDIHLVGTALAKVGFQIIAPVKDANRDQILYAVHDLADRLRAAGPGAIGFFYYSGHGVAVGGDNFLIPISVLSTTRRDLDVSGVKLAEIVAILNEHAPQAVHFIVFDACRNNLGGSKGSKGFVPVTGRPGMLMAFSAAPGATASDEGKNSGPYAAALAAELVSRGRNHGDMFFEVRRRVANTTGQEQVPWTQDGLLARVHFGGEAPKPPVAPVTPPPRPETTRAEVAQICQSVATNPSIAVVQSMLDTYKGTPMAACVQARISELQTQKPPTAVATASPKQTAPLVTGTVRPAKVVPERPVVGIGPPPDTKRPPPPKQGPRPLDANAADVMSLPRLFRAPEPGEKFKDCETCPEMVVVPAGEFMMGSPADEEGHNENEGPVRKVKIGKAFTVGRYEVTRGEFAAFAKATGHKAEDGCRVWTGKEWKAQADKGWTSPGFDQTDRHPVTCVSWHDATAFAKWLASRTGKKYRLLTEAEWEFAARAGTTTAFSTGATISTDQANFDGKYTYAGSAKGLSRETTTDVGTFGPNGFGLYDMHGNAWEWVADCYEPSRQGAPTDGSARSAADCGLRVLRGGSWFHWARNARSADRIRYQPDIRYNYLGFRVARPL